MCRFKTRGRDGLGGARLGVACGGAHLRGEGEVDGVDGGHKDVAHAVVREHGQVTAVGLAQHRQQRLRLRASLRRSQSVHHV